jgi:transcription elongation factor Elf1
MVHYQQDRRITEGGALPRCPKCRSHRMEMIGMSADLATAYLRCAACGGRAELSIGEPRDAVATDG